MDIQSEKLEIIKLLLATNDETIIESIKNIFEIKENAVWNKLSTEQQEKIDLKILEENRGDQVDL
ncbi:MULTISPECIES: hypothetical protein [unclassified Flavobacterium]|jgi:hypothetical protein|uniref:hypothetical protein n=1 Tax=unclassified Flavobacterium TaxID=196869 RepID=UPI003F8FC3AB